MDFTDFDALARSYDYNPAAFLIALRRAGLTSLALTEELGANVGNDGKAYATTGAALINQARLSPISDPLLASAGSDAADSTRAPSICWSPIRRPTIATSPQLRCTSCPGALRVLARHAAVADRSAHADRLLQHHGTGHSDRPDRTGAPARAARRSAFSERRALRRAADRSALQRRAALRSEGLDRDLLRSAQSGARLSRSPRRYRRRFQAPRASTSARSKRTIDSQVQKGNDTLARLIPGRTVRVQAIAKGPSSTRSNSTRSSRATFSAFASATFASSTCARGRIKTATLSIEETNVEMVKQIADELRANGFRLGRATPIPLYRGNNRRSRRPRGAGGSLDLRAAARLLRLVPAPLRGRGVRADGRALRRGRRGPSRRVRALGYRACGRAALRHGGAARLDSGVDRSARGGVRHAAAAQSRLDAGRDRVSRLLGALVVVGVMSSPLAMEEIERFRGVRLVLALPPLIALALYLFDRRFGSGVERPRDVFLSPVLAYQLLAGIAIVALGALHDHAQRQRERHLAVAVRAGAAPRAHARAERASALQGVSDRRSRA